MPASYRIESNHYVTAREAADVVAKLPNVLLIDVRTYAETLFNVLKGTLSLVGPRPHAVSAKAAGKLYDEAVDSYFARHKVKPGITGWAQINGWRGETDTEEKLIKRIEHDLEYIENWSLLLDLYILVKTPLSLLKTENAY